MLSSHSASFASAKNFNTDLFYYPVACFVQTFKTFFLHNEILYYLSLSHVMDTSRTFFAFLLVKHQLKRLIAWQSASLVTSYSCNLYQISCLKFHPNFRSHCGRVFRMMLEKIKYIMLSSVTRETFLVFHLQKKCYTIIIQLNISWASERSEIVRHWKAY